MGNGKFIMNWMDGKQEVYNKLDEWEMGSL